ncbi:TPA: LemA family protein [Candidatus Woesearchaeota archaeon]|nr:LemA family protein [Candidatus Woesearchaeota archaeon]
MKQTTKILLGVLGAIIVLAIIIGLWIAGTYNGLVSSDENVGQKWSNVQTAYQRRADLIPNLVETVKGYKDYEGETLTAITQLRSEAGQAKTAVDGATTPAQLDAAKTSMDGVLSRLLVIVEAYPDLKANENFLSLQDEIAGTENRVKVERDNFNEAVKDYNVKVRRFPSNIIAGIFGFDVKTGFAAAPGTENAPKVTF